ncbi:MAG TPA: NUDIX domain-containing protein [Actinocrinis sp.]|uniref:NUDIX hydrolase n=1 Tax=Actinocrinis sp. TaxID=1920516 RepID=UPI002DDCD2FB|nr:NUDIX domain-containing protein [Actinocrinis sp.]HEV2347962.1 NUDIX domain-containing protein [Actinocrinis sp.]
MAIHLEKITATVDAYLLLHPDEREALAPLLAALGKGFDFTSRRRYPAHITAGVVLLDGEGRMLQVHHRGLGRWVSPGGHCEPEDKSLTATALRELAEECGIASDEIEPVGGVDGIGGGAGGGEDALPIHIDVHPIPASDVKAEPAHRHFDFRFAFRTGAVVPQLTGRDAPVHRWHPVRELGDLALAARLGQLLESS